MKAVVFWKNMRRELTYDELKEQRRMCMFGTLTPPEEEN